MQRHGQVYVTVSMGSSKESEELRTRFYQAAKDKDESFSKWAVKVLKRELEAKAN